MPRILHVHEIGLVGFPDPVGADDVRVMQDPVQMLFSFGKVVGQLAAASSIKELLARNFDNCALNDELDMMSANLPRYLNSWSGRC